MTTVSTWAIPTADELALLLRVAKLLDVQPDYFFRGCKEEDWKTA
jgi:hypothetical protein